MRRTCTGKHRAGAVIAMNCEREAIRLNASEARDRPTDIPAHAPSARHGGGSSGPPCSPDWTPKCQTRSPAKRRTTTVDVFIDTLNIGSNQGSSWAISDVSAVSSLPTVLSSTHPTQPQYSDGTCTVNTKCCGWVGFREDCKKCKPAGGLRHSGMSTGCYEVVISWERLTSTGLASILPVLNRYIKNLFLQ